MQKHYSGKVKRFHGDSKYVCMRYYDSLKMHNCHWPLRPS